MGLGVIFVSLYFFLILLFNYIIISCFVRKLVTDDIGFEYFELIKECFGYYICYPFICETGFMAFSCGNFLSGISYIQKFISEHKSSVSNLKVWFVPP